MREHDFDVKAFPKFHPSGHFGLNHLRPKEKKLSPQAYFQHRLLNADERFSRDPCYLFMASYFVERLAIERQIDISGRKGCKPTINENGEQTVHLNDMFDVFKKVKGTPKFWQVARNDMVAKVANPRCCTKLGLDEIFALKKLKESFWLAFHLYNNQIDTHEKIDLGVPT